MPKFKFFQYPSIQPLYYSVKILNEMDGTEI